MLHIVNKSPEGNGALASCLRLARDGDAVLLIEDAVYAATQALCATSGLQSAQPRLKVYVLQPDLEARGMAAHRVPAIEPVDYGGFVELAAANPASQSWL